MKVSVQACVPDASSSTLHKDIASSSETLEPRRSKRAGIKSSFGPNFITTFLAEKECLDEQDVNSFALEENPRFVLEEAMRYVGSSLVRGH